MYKKQIKFQKVVCYIALAASVVLFFYSLGLLTDLYDSLYPTMMNPANHEETWVPGSIIYYDMQPFNNRMLIMGLVAIGLALFLFVMGTHERRRYYIGNYVSTALYVAGSVFFSAFCLTKLAAFKAQYLQIDFEALASFAEMWDTRYIESTFWFDAGYFVFGLMLLASVLLIVNLIWKIDMMKSERALLKEGE